MKLKIMEDAQVRPDLFQWNGAIPEEVLTEWIRKAGLIVPPELFNLWKETGGGDAFESETILGPLESAEMGDDVLGTTAFFHQRGLCSDIYLFHRGTWLSGIEMSAARFVLMNERDFSVRARFTSLDKWYLSTIRQELSWRYGLP